MTKSEWKTFLKEYNRELLSYEGVIEALPRELIKDGWLGYDSAAEEEVLAVEKHLGTSLPPSYRAFLRVSNGWRFPSTSIVELRKVDKVDWFSNQNHDWVDTYVRGEEGMPQVSDEEYFVYGGEQDCTNFRAEYLQTALQISEVNDGAVILLNPKVVTSGGEWETWLFANWLPGAVRYRTFADWLTKARKACREQLKPLLKSKVKKYVTAKKPVSVRKAQEASRGGHTELAIDSLESFAAKGDDSAAASLAELYAFLGQWDRVIANAGRLIANPDAVYAANVFDDMIRLLGRVGHRSGEWKLIQKVVEVASGSHAKRFTTLRRDLKTKLERDILKGQEDRNEKIFRNLICYADRQGKPPHELVAIFGVRGSMEGMNNQQRRAWYDNAIKNVDSLRPDLKKNPRAKTEHFFSLAKGVWEDEALRLYEEHGAGFEMAWQAVEYVAPIYVQRGNPQTAWSVIESNIRHWWPVDHAQVAPLILLTNEHLEGLMTPERCQQVLSTPRGSEGAKPAK